MNQDKHTPQDQDLENLPPSKSQLKREMTERQKIGIAITTLSKSRIQALNLPEKLLDALKDWQKITAHEGKRRQFQYIGKLMRNVDIEPIQKALLEQAKGSAEQTLQLHHLEHLRNQLLDDGSAGHHALTQWAQQHPQSDLQQLRSLIRSARKDVAQTPEKRSGKAYRELYQFLKEND